MKKTALGILSVLLAVFLFFSFSEHEAYADDCDSPFFCDEGERRVSLDLTRKGVSFTCKLLFESGFLDKISIGNSSFGLGYSCWNENKDSIFTFRVCGESFRKGNIDLKGSFGATIGEVTNCDKLFDLIIFNDN